MKRELGAVVVLAALVLGSCGGGSEDDDGEPTTRGSANAPSRLEFIKQADEICRVANRRARRLNQRASAIVKRASDDETALAKLEPILRKGLADQGVPNRDFERLTPPRGDEKQFRKMVNDSREQTALLSSLAAAADLQDVDTFEEARKEQERVNGPARRFLQGYGFKECGSGKNDAD